MILHKDFSCIVTRLSGVVSPSANLEAEYCQCYTDVLLTCILYQTISHSFFMVPINLILRTKKRNINVTLATYGLQAIHFRTIIGGLH